MKTIISIWFVPIMLLIYWLTVVQKLPHNGAIFIPCSPAMMCSFETLQNLNYIMYTLMYPIKILFCSKLSFTNIDFFWEDLLNYKETWENIVFLWEIAFPFGAIGLISAFLYLLRKSSSVWGLLLPFFISIAYGFFWYLERIHDGVLPFLILFFYILFGMFWAIISQGMYWLLEFLEKKKDCCETKVSEATEKID